MEHHRTNLILWKFLWILLHKHQIMAFNTRIEQRSMEIIYVGLKNIQSMSHDRFKRYLRFNLLLRDTLSRIIQNHQETMALEI